MRGARIGQKGESWNFPPKFGVGHGEITLILGRHKMTREPVLAIFALLFLLAGPNCPWVQETTDSDQRAKYIQTMEDMRRVSAAIKNYSIDFGYVPKATNISDLKKALEG